MEPNDSTTLTFSHVYNDLKEAINGMADALKVGSDHVYQILVRQQFVNSITWILIIAMLFTTAGISLKLGLKDMWTIDKYQDKVVKDSKVPLLICGGIGILVAIVLFSFNISTIVTGFVNPEYGAIMEIKKFIR